MERWACAPPHCGRRVSIASRRSESVTMAAPGRYWSRDPINIRIPVEADGPPGVGAKIERRRFFHRAAFPPRETDNPTRFCDTENRQAEFDVPFEHRRAMEDTPMIRQVFTAVVGGAL